MNKSAVMSYNGLYRYQLKRHWCDDRSTLSVIMLNPSTADANRDDATIRKLIGFAKRADYGGIEVYNLFAYRSTNPKWLVDIADPVGPVNDQWLDQEVRGDVLCAWGNIYARWNTRAQQVMEIVLRNGCRTMALKLTAAGHPCHPVRLPYHQAKHWVDF